MTQRANCAKADPSVGISACAQPADHSSRAHQLVQYQSESRYCYRGPIRFVQVSSLIGRHSNPARRSRRQSDETVSTGLVAVVETVCETRRKVKVSASSNAYSSRTNSFPSPSVLSLVPSQVGPGRWQVTVEGQVKGRSWHSERIEIEIPGLYSELFDYDLWMAFLVG